MFFRIISQNCDNQQDWCRWSACAALMCCRKDARQTLWPLLNACTEFPLRKLGWMRILDGIYPEINTWMQGYLSIPVGIFPESNTWMQGYLSIPVGISPESNTWMQGYLSIPVGIFPRSNSWKLGWTSSVGGLFPEIIKPDPGREVRCNPDLDGKFQPFFFYSVGVKLVSRTMVSTSRYKCWYVLQTKWEAKFQKLH